MAIVFLEGFDHYQPGSWIGSGPGQITVPNFFTKWSYANGSWQECQIGPAFARDGIGQGAQLGSRSDPMYNSYLFKTLLSNQATLVCGAAVYFNGVLPQARGILAFYDVGTEQISLRGDGAGHLIVSRAGTLLATSTLTVSVNTFYYIEFKATIHNSAGAYEVRVNGVTYISGSSANTRNTANAYANQFVIGDNNGYSVRYDDLYVLDTTGAVNTDFLGPISIATLRPVGPGHYAQWTPNGAPNFAAVREQTPNSDALYNGSATPDQIDTFAMEKLPEVSGAVFAVQHVLYARQDGGAQRVIAPVQRVGSTDYVGASLSTPGTYAFLTDIHNVDPATGVAWTLSSLTAAEFGYKEVS